MITANFIRKDPARTLLLEQTCRKWSEKTNRDTWGDRVDQQWSLMWAIDEKSLIQEYHVLVDLDLQVELTPEQRERLILVEEQLDNLDEATSEAHFMTSQMLKTTDQLDALLEAVRDLAVGRVTQVP